MRRTSFDFDVISGPVEPRPAPRPAPKPTPQAATTTAAVDAAQTPAK
jgi:hypothetical protein